MKASLPLLIVLALTPLALFGQLCTTTTTTAGITTTTTILACIGNPASLCPTSCVTNSVCLSNNGVIAGGNCYLCVPGSVYVNGVCTASSSSCTGQLTCMGPGCIYQSQCISSLWCTVRGGNPVNNLICVFCALGQTFVSGSCINSITCPPGQSLVNGVCSCPTGFVLTNGQCVANVITPSANSTCPNNLIALNGQCVCQTGYYYINGQCYVSLQCGVNQYYSYGQCLCNPGYGYINGICQVCSGQASVNSIGACVCNAGYVKNPITGNCILPCQANAGPNNLDQCVCSAGFYTFNGQCLPAQTCPPGLTWSNVTFTCVCPTGLYLDYFTLTCSNCDLTQNRQIVGGQCNCNIYSYPSNGVCVACGVNSYPSLNQCICWPGYGLVNGVCTWVTNCPAGQYTNSTYQCAPCQTTNCVTCDSGNTCTACAVGYQLNIFLNGNVIITTCWYNAGLVPYTAPTGTPVPTGTTGLNTGSTTGTSP